jgi:drug/metabolite transporter (DMT)-like permease
VRVVSIALDAVLALIGLGVFVYGDLATNRTARIVGVTVVTVAVVVAAILASNRDEET